MPTLGSTPTPSALNASKSALPVYGIASCGAGPAPALAALDRLRPWRCCPAGGACPRGAPPSQARSVHWRVPLEGSWECTPKAPAQKRLGNFSPPLRPMHPNASDQRCFCRKSARNTLVSQSNRDQLQERAGTMLTGARGSYEKALVALMEKEQCS
jgi:hypothetical protein